MEPLFYTRCPEARILYNDSSPHMDCWWCVCHGYGVDTLVAWPQDCPDCVDGLTGRCVHPDKEGHNRDSECVWEPCPACDGGQLWPTGWTVVRTPGHSVFGWFVALEEEPC